MGVTFTTNHTTKPRIYVACLAAYNSGILHGTWIDAAQETWTLWDEVSDMLIASPIAGAEEWAIHDHEGFGGVPISTYAGLDTIAALASFVAEHGELGMALLEHCDGDVEEARATLDDRYIGSHASLADYVQEVTEEGTAIPASLRYYIDWRAMARDAEMSGDLFTVQTAYDVVHVFTGH
jgi:antirestriction protein